MDFLQNMIAGFIIFLAFIYLLRLLNRKKKGNSCGSCEGCSSCCNSEDEKRSRIYKKMPEKEKDDS